MISVKRLWDRLSALTKTGTSGYFTAEEFNSNLYSVQYTVLAIGADEYENTQKVTDALINHTKTYNGLTKAGGQLFSVDILTDVEDYYRTLAVTYKSLTDEYPSKKISIGEARMYLTSPIRRPNLGKGRTLYYFTDSNIFLLPRSPDLEVDLTYLRKPTEALIVFTTEEDEDNDYLVVDEENTIDIDFPEGLFNLFVYLMLESMGIEQKENLATEYSQLGINRTIQTDLK